MWPQATRVVCYSLFGMLMLGVTRASGAAAAGPSPELRTEIPIKHLVVIFQENASFDSYFATYPIAANPRGLITRPPPFKARRGTPSINGLNNSLLNFNPNLVNPFRIARLDCFTCDQNHDYQAELEARNQGLMNKYVEFGARPAKEAGEFCKEVEIDGAMTPVTDMGYFDGNTVTALWNYAQFFALNDNAFATMNGESTRGHINLVQADAYGALCAPANGKTGKVWVDGGATVPFCDGPVASVMTAAPTNGALGTLVGDADPYWDICSEAKDTVAMTGRNIGDLLNARGVTWGWFQGGFKLPEQTAAGCTANQHPKVAYDEAIGVDPDQDPVQLVDYVPHHNPFQYYQSTANPMHMRPSSPAMIGRSDQANHLYDLEDLWDAADSGNLPAVSFLKAANYQDGHPGQSEPLDEQVFIVETLNRLQQLPGWRSMAVIIAWDDSDGWYDHVMPPIINRSTTAYDSGSSGQPLCGNAQDGPGARCVYGPRLPFLLISPFARENYVSHVLTDQTSITRFIEDNWLAGERISNGNGALPASFDAKAGSLMDMFDFSGASGGGGHARHRRLFLDPQTGRVLKQPPRTN
jgi:phospholipase C